MAAEGSLLPQFLFASNLTKTVRIREKIPGDIERPSRTNGLIHHFRRLHRYTVELFRLSHFSPQFREKVQAALLDKALQTALEQLRNLNWCREVTKLVPLKTNGDGNCLLHATSQFMWGVQDIDLALRKTLWEALKGTDTRNFKFRWQIECVRSQQFDATGLRYDTKNWDEEWDKVVKMASAASNLGQPGLSYGSLEEIHIFVLANILRRPIIVIADRVVRSFCNNTSLAPLHFGGIYLPLHWPAQECYKYPIIIGYDAQHFAPLVADNDIGPAIRAVPLVHNEGRRFEDFMIHFLTPEEEKNKEKLLKEYFNLIEIPAQGQDFGTTDLIKAARLDEGNLPEDLNLVEDYYQLVNHEFKKWQQSPGAMSRPAYQPVRMNPAAVQGSLIEEKCATRGCPYYCSVETKPICHECFERANCRKTESKPKPHEQQKKKGSRPVWPELVNAAIEPEPSSRPRSAPPTAPSLFLFSETSAMKCKVPTCPFTLNVQYNGLCERCFKARTALPGNVPDNRTSELRLAHRNESSSEQLGSPQENIRTKQGPVNPLHQEQTWCSRCHQDVLKTINGLCNTCLLRTFRGNCNSSFEGTSSSHSGHERSHSDPCQLVKNAGLPSVTDQHQVSNLCPSINGLQGSDSTQHSRGTHGSEELREGVPKCKKPGCMYFGTQQHQGFCTLCFIEYKTNLGDPLAINPNRAQRNQQRSHQPSPSDPRFQNMARCRGQDCETFGKTLFEGYCEKCFIAAQHQRINEATGCRGQSNINAGEHGHSDRNELRRQQIKCARNYCNNFVNTSTEELCLQCHQRNCGSSQDQVESYPQKPRCQTIGCDHFGNEKCNGYCNECYHFVLNSGGQ
ncbi:tumor necrosis factor alpha-induced protein 3 [Callorhinchus milii]|uniref:ubiquitinyl hydrolase 1 n=1 Tax=Callorhinchus milii TaxID=7868 RepID=V9KCX2_CALMI|nr:tumor necrosis factor alpha-induced protein 3 [Callorhinchus milii]